MAVIMSFLTPPMTATAASDQWPQADDSILSASKLLPDPASGSTSDPSIIANSYIVTYSDGTAPTRSEVNTDAVEAINSVDNGVAIASAKLVSGDIAAVQLENGVSAAVQEEFVATLESQPDVVTVEPNRLVSALKTNDTRYASLWNITTGSSFGVNAEGAWSKSTGKGVVIAIIDTGITLHPDLKSNILMSGKTPYGYDFVTDHHVSNDDVYSRDGDNWDSNPTDPGDYCAETGDSSSWHGTHVAGIAAAVKDNGQGVAGVAPNSSIEAVRAIGGCGGALTDVIAAITWSSGLPVAGAPINTHPADVINMSLGSQGKCTTALNAAIEAATDAGSVVVAATGNGATFLSNSSPANCANVVRVAASTDDGSLAGYSNHGSTTSAVTIAAPGGGSWRYNDTTGSLILSTVNGGTTTATSSWTYASYQGTSMATPHVSGIVALLKSLDPTLNGTQIADILIATSTDFPYNASFADIGSSSYYYCEPALCGAGIANAANAVKLFPSVNGDSRVGQTLTMSSSGWTSNTHTYKWYRNGRPITGASKPTYIPVAADLGNKITVSIVGKVGGSTLTLTSSAKEVAKGTIVNKKAPKVSGKTKVGKKLKVTAGTWTPKAKVSIRWYRNGKAINAAVKTTYKLTSKDKGKRITVKVTAKKTGYTTVSKTILAAKKVKAK